MSSGRVRARCAIWGAAKWLPLLFGLGIAANGHAQTQGLPAPMSGDCVTSAAGAVTCSKTGGVAFAPSATTDATNATNITAGTLPYKEYDPLPKWRAAVKGVLAGSGQARFCPVGDSTTMGVGSTGSVALTGQNYIPYSWPVQAANLMQTAYGVKTSWDSFFGAGYNTTNFGSSDSRIVAGSSWTQNTAMLSYGGYTWKATTATNSFNFTPTGTDDTFRVFFVQGTSQGVASIQVDSGTATTFSTTGAAGVAVFTTTGLSVGTHTIKISWSSGGEVDLIGVEGYDSTSHKVIFDLTGASGIRTVELSSTAIPAGGGNSAIYAAIGCNLTTNMLGINDYDTGVSLSSYTTNLQTMAAAEKAAGSDVMFESPFPTNPASAGISVATQNTYTEAMRGVAVANTNGNGLPLPFVDSYNMIGSFAAGATQNMYADTFAHFNAGGYFQIASQMVSAIAPAPTQPVGPLYPSPISIRADNSGNYAFGGSTIPSLTNAKSTWMFWASGVTIPLVSINQGNTGYSGINASVADYSYLFGTAGSGESTFGVAHKAYLLDFVRAKIVWACDATGQCAFGYNSGGAQATTYPHPWCWGSACQSWMDNAGNATTVTQTTGQVVSVPETIAFSATPTFSATVEVSRMVLTGNVTSFTLAAGVDGAHKTLVLCQDSTGSRTFPSVSSGGNVFGLGTVGSTAGKCSAQEFKYQTLAGYVGWYASGPMVTNM